VPGYRGFLARREVTNAADLPTIKRIEITVAVRGNQAPFGLSTQAVVRNGR
jgi:hypothetical protein